MTIPVLKPSITDEEIQAVVEVMRSGWLGLGPKTNEFEEKFAEYIKAKYCVALNSCTAALHLVTNALNLGPDEEVIVTPMTFISTVHSISYCGAKPVFADILPDTLNINPADVNQKITSKTRAIIGVDMAGHPCDLDELMKLATDHGLTFIEDAAHACGALYKGKPVGSIAPFTCFSFHAVKNLTCGEGGAITGTNEWFEKWFKEMRWLGISKDTWERSEEKHGYQWKYWVENMGFKYHMSDIAAAIGIVQLRRLSQLNQIRQNIANEYNQAFADIDWLTLPQERSYVKSSWHLYQVKLPDEISRDRMINHLLERGITPGVHYLPAHLHPYYRPLKSICPVASEIWKRLISLPIYPDLSQDDQGKVIEAIRNFKP
ncbi:MAG TPA: DegT/DnrJ/EryC1/StrS aminotransferase family protein [Firmicutes bacterium]|jgi:perosamine synthetase|nr:DegT/DnrJ/EryC1/StrS aminotransferase family protein [Bacillota bacterium]